MSRPHPSATFRAFADDEATPLAFVEAALLEPRGKREAAIERAAVELANATDPDEAAREIEREFFGKAPKTDYVPDPDPRSPSAMMAFEPPIPSAPGDAKPADVGPLLKRDDDRRTTEELDVAAKVLCGAVERNARLKATVQDIGLGVRLLGLKTKDKSLSGFLNGVAEKIRKSCAAAGTRTEPAEFKRDTTARLVEEALARGATFSEVDTIARASKAWETLKPTGIRATRAEFIAQALDRDRDREETAHE